MHHPLVTIVTINLNNAAELEQTLKSVLAQDYDHLELIVVDGASTDGSVDVIRKYQPHIARFVSEPDRGIYDAMAKGVGLASGEYVCFVNSGDQLAHKSAVSDTFAAVSGARADLIYGGHETRYERGFSRISWPDEPKQLWKRMICSHQALFTRRSLLQDMPFDQRFKLNADYAFIYRAYRGGATLQRVNVIVASVSAGGSSDVDRRTSIVSRWQIVRGNPYTFRADVYYAWLLLDFKLRAFAKRFLSKNLVLKIAASKKSRQLPAA